MIDLSSVDVENLLRRLGWRFPGEESANARTTSSGDEINFSCFGPEHSHGDESPSAYINIESTAWFCHGCKRKGNAVSLVMEVNDVSRPTAETSLRDWYGIVFNEPLHGSMVAETEARFRPVAEEPEPPKPPASWLSGTRLDWSGPLEPFQKYMVDRGLSLEVLQSWDIGYDYVSDRVTIPVYDVDGELVGVKGRDWTGQREPKYLILGDRPGKTRYGFVPYEASNVLFGLNRRRDCKTAVLLEGELNAIALDQLGVPRPVATGMSYLTDRHVELLVREVDEVIVFYDYGDAGHTGVWGRFDKNRKFHPGVVHRLEPFVRVRVVTPLPEDPAKLLQLGRGQEALQLIEQARSPLTTLPIFR